MAAQLLYETTPAQPLNVAALPDLPQGVGAPAPALPPVPDDDAGRRGRSAATGGPGRRPGRLPADARRPAGEPEDERPSVAAVPTGLDQGPQLRAAAREAGRGYE